MFAMLDPRVWLVVGVLMAGAGLGGFFKGIGYEKDKQARVALEQSENNRELERQASRANAKVDDDYTAKIRAADASAAVTRSELGRLRSAVANLPATPEAPQCFDGERDATLRRLLGESAELVAEGNERVGSLTAKVGGLQSYITEVCGMQLKEKL